MPQPCLARKHGAKIGEALDLDRVARRVQKKHRGLFAWLPRKTYAGWHYKRHILGSQPVCQCLPLGHLQDHTQVGHGNHMLTHLAGVGGGKRSAQMQRNLVAKEIEIDPCIGAAPLTAAQYRAVKLARGRRSPLRIDVAGGVCQLQARKIGVAGVFAHHSE